jgi:glucose-induced degradation protein 4
MLTPIEAVKPLEVDPTSGAVFAGTSDSLKTHKITTDSPTIPSIEEAQSDSEKTLPRPNSAISSPDTTPSHRFRANPMQLQPLVESLHRPNSSSSFLQPGSRFTGIQRSLESQKYEVVVDIQHVDMANSFLCGYLKISELAPEHPTLTTYFEGEIIGSKYGFITQHPEWGAKEKLDMEHWAKFSGFRNHARDAKKPGYTIRNWQTKEHIWMRWKEYFLVPDHRVTDLAGASFEGFYYICFNQISGEIEGIYYHAKSPK